MASIGTTRFLELAGGISTTLMRKLESIGVIHPERTDDGKGHRSFRLRDVVAAKKWIAQQGARK